MFVRQIFVTLLLVCLTGFVQAARDLPDFTALVKKVGPGVVNISTTQKIKHRRGMPPHMEIPENTPFDDFFRRFFGEPGPGEEPEEFSTQSLGSGFVIDKSGYIITNNHVVRDAEEIIVRFSDRREFKAEVIGKDDRSDVALLKVDADDLPVVKLGDSHNLRVGEWVMAIGSPFGFDHSVSVGVVSAIGRNLPSENYVPFIQTDVAINPGNSGGPLFNLEGEVVGINSQIYSRTGGFMGLSFAIPVSLAVDVVQQLKSKGHVTRGWLGILIQDVNKELAESFGMEKPMGAAVLRVLDDSPAAAAGFLTGDVVVEFDGKTIHRSSDLPLAVGVTAIGKKVRVKIIREGKTKYLTVTIGELPQKGELAERSTPEQPHEMGKLGITVDELSAEQRRRSDVKKGGVVVLNVDKGVANDAGIRRGDIILKLNHKDITDAKQFKEIVSKLAKGKSAPILIQRGRAPIFLAIKIP